MGRSEVLKRLAELDAGGRLSEAVALSAEAVDDFPDDQPILRARALLLRRAGCWSDAAEFLTDVLARLPLAAWAHAQAGLLHRQDRALCLTHFREAFRLQPSHDHRLGLIGALSRTGDGLDLDAAYFLLKPVLAGASNWTPNDLSIAYDVLRRVCAYDELDTLGDPLDLGRKWADAGDHSALLYLLNQATTPARRDALLELHKRATRPMAEVAAREPLWLDDA